MVAQGNTKGDFLLGNTRGKLTGDEPQHDVYSGSPQILLTRMPLDIVLFLCYFVTHLEVLHFHGTRALLFNRVVHNNDGGGVIAMDGGFRLRVA